MRTAPSRRFKAMAKSASALLAALAALAVVFALTLPPRMEAADASRTGSHGYGRWWNLEVPAHVLSTLHAWRALPVAQHHFLPILQPDDLELDALKGSAGERWPDTAREHGAFVRTREGWLLYQSFPPGGFLAAHLALTVAGVEPSIPSLLRFSMVLQAVSATLLMLLGYMIAGRWGLGPWLRAAAGTVGALPYLLSVEAFHSHGAVYWGQQFSQPIMLAGALAFLLRGRPLLRSVLLGTVVFVCVLTEWTGHVFAAAGMAVSAGLLLIHRDERREHFFGLIGPAAGWLGGCLALGLWYSTHVDLGSMWEGIAARYGTRSGGSGLAATWFRAFLLGHGPWACLAALFALVARLGGARWPKGGGREVAVLAILATVCLENLVVLNHAGIYTFDHLKIVALEGVVMAAATAVLLQGRRLGQRGAASVVIVGGVVAAGLVSMQTHRAVYGNHPYVGSEKGILETVCLSGPAQRAAQVTRTLEPGDLFLSDTGLYPARPDRGRPLGASWDYRFSMGFQEALLGRRAVTAENLGTAIDALERSSRRSGRWYVVSGHDFDRPGDVLRIGRISVEVAFRKGDGAADITVYPAARDTPIGGTPIGLMKFHNAAAVAALPVGGEVLDADGAAWRVITADIEGRSATMVRSDGTTPVGNPAFLRWTQALDDRLRSLASPEPLSLADDELSCTGAG